VNTRARGSVRRFAPQGPQSGQALVELAFVVPILVLLVMAIFQFAFVIESQMGLTNAVREAGRRAAATSSEDPDWTALRVWTLEQLNGDGGSNPGLLAQNVQAYDVARLWATYPSVSVCKYTVGSAFNYRIQIDVKYKHPIFFGPMTLFTDAVDGTGNGDWDLSASAQMRIENADPTLVTTQPSDCPS
jgi:hypothetical protein